MSSLDNILAEVRQIAEHRLGADSGPAPWDAGRVAEDAALLEVAAGNVSPDHLEQSLAAVLAEGGEPEVLLALSGVLTRAANLAGDGETAVRSAALLARAALEIGRVYGPGAPQTVAPRALELVGAAGLVGDEPDLVADLHLEVGNRYMGAAGPERVYLGLTHFATAYRLKMAARSPDAPRLGEIIREAARFTLGMAEVAAGMPADSGVGEALPRAEAALEAFSALGDDEGVSAARLLLAETLLQAGRVTAAAGQLTALSATRRPVEGDRVSLLRAEILLRRERATEALAALDDARPGAVDHLRRRALGLRGDALLQLGRVPEATSCFEALLAELPVDPDGEVELAGRRQRARAAAELAVIACGKGNVPAARRWVTEALNALAGLPELERLEVHLRVAGAFGQAGAPGDAGAHLAAASELMGRLPVEDAARRVQLRSRRADIEVRRAELELESSPEEALELLEAAHALALWDMVSAGGRSPGVPTDLTAAHRTVAERTAVLRAHLARLPAGGRAAAAAQGELEALSRRAEAIRQIAELEISGVRAAAGRHALPGAAAATDRLLGGRTGSAVLWFLARPDRIGVLVRRDGSTRGRWLPVSGAAVRRAVESLLRDLGHPDEQVDGQLRWLGEALLAPVADMLGGVRDLVLVPHRGLHAIPWSGVGGPEAPLVDRVERLSVIPSVMLAVGLAERARLAGGGAVLVDQCDTPVTCLENDAVGESLADRAAGSRATRLPATSDPLRVAAASAGAAVVQVAAGGTAHGEGGHVQLGAVDGEVPVFDSGVGRLGVAGVRGLLDLRACETVVLSGTLPGRAGSSDLPGLPTALLGVGARWVVARLWSVGDASTLLLLLEFHRRLAAGRRAGVLDPPAALAAAQRWLRWLARAEAAALVAAAVVDAERRLPAAVLPFARAQLVLPPGELPFHQPHHWGAYACFGAQPEARAA